jgi:hypothetical protein
MPLRTLLLPAVCLAASAAPLCAGVVHCSDLKAVSATSGWSTVQKDLSIDKKPITLGGKVYPKGLGTHAPSDIVYDLAGKYALFTSDVGIDDETAGKGSVEFKVFADDSLLYASGVMKGNVAAKKISVSVAGKSKLKLTVTIGPDTYDMDDADWAAPQLTEKETTVLRIGKASGGGDSKRTPSMLFADPGPDGFRRDALGRGVRIPALP